MLRVELVQVEALWERVVTALRRAIVIGELPPGAHLKEPLLAQRFGVSRLPVREAITQLDREGLVRIEPRRGAFVIGVTEQDISDIYECRLMIETTAVRRTVHRATPDALEELAEFVHQMRAAAATGQPQQLAAADMGFHRQIVALSGNRALARAWEPIAPLIETILGISDTTIASAELPGAIDSHLEIIGALARRDVAEAEKLLKDHLLGGEGLVHQAIRSVSAVPAEA